MLGLPRPTGQVCLGDAPRLEDEYGKKLNDQARGVAEKRLQLSWQFGTRYEAEDGFLLSSRGNPIGNVVRRGNQVVVHSATGQDFQVPVLKTINQDKKWKDPLQTTLWPKRSLKVRKRHVKNI